MSETTPGDMPGARQSNVFLVSGGRRDFAAAPTATSERQKLTAAYIGCSGARHKWQAVGADLM